MKPSKTICKIGAGILSPIVLLGAGLISGGVGLGIGYGLLFLLRAVAGDTGIWVLVYFLLGWVLLVAISLLGASIFWASKELFYPTLYEKCVTYWHKNDL